MLQFTCIKRYFCMRPNFSTQLRWASRNFLVPPACQLLDRQNVRGTREFEQISQSISSNDSIIRFAKNGFHCACYYTRCKWLRWEWRMNRRMFIPEVRMKFTWGEAEVREIRQAKFRRFASGTKPSTAALFQFSHPLTNVFCINRLSIIC